MDLALWLTHSGSNNPCLEQIFMVLKMFQVIEVWLYIERPSQILFWFSVNKIIQSYLLSSFFKWQLILPYYFIPFVVYEYLTLSAFSFFL